MKKVIIAVSVGIAIVIGFLVFMQNVNINRLGAEPYYVQVNEGKKMEGKTGTGEKYVYYEYTLQAFDKKGQEKPVTFTANKQLRKEAFLCVFVKGDKVSSYQEVALNEVPVKAKVNLQSSSSS
ncbi:YxeA family protein [Paenibacillus sp. SYP-B3998]|uniref:YxeA family protein n=1 Tax=Paenibacillus sp. SYP-B3998 TaxID=2678564 RepID=A0A6G3ZTY8_9BACL|nr:YxeA family protein [Paenibacillus sp. SYP-B3998]NEW05673.1 YxeA family protein [Paenibacillus sp. SYP-B3998]